MPTLPTNITSVYGLLDAIRALPRMHVANIRDLRTLVFGYGLALDVHGITEPGRPIEGFGAWLRARGFDRATCPWEGTVDDAIPDGTPEEKFAMLFALLDVYRAGA